MSCKTINIDLTNVPPVPIQIGVAGENSFRTITFDASKWGADYPDATYTVVYRRSDGYLYPVLVNASADAIVWNPTGTDTAVSGNGQLEVRLLDGETIGKTIIMQTYVAPSLSGDESEPSTPAPDWVNDVADDADRAEDAVSHYPQIRAGYWWMWDVAIGKWVNTGDSANGLPGKSAYQIAVDNGYTGTEEEWLASLKGEQGEPGKAKSAYIDYDVVRLVEDDSVYTSLLMRADIGNGVLPFVLRGIESDSAEEYFELDRQDLSAASPVIHFRSKEHLLSVDSAGHFTLADRAQGGSTVYVTPEEFGAVGDGVADDTAAVRQAMQNPAVALQKTYKVTEAITCAAQLVQGIDGGGIVSSAGGLVFANDARLMDFSASLPHGYDGNVVEAQGSVYADGLTVTGGKVGILASGQYKAVEIRNCRISDQWGESSRGIYVPFAGETLIEGNKVDTVANDTTVNADGISVWQSKEEQHPTVVIRGNTIHNCKGRFIKASTRDAVIEANYCSNDSDVAVIPYFVGIDVQNGCSIVRGNTVIAPSGINVSLRDTAGLHSVHAIEYNKLVYNGVPASNKTMIATTDYANGNASSQVSIVGNDITARGDTSASIALAYMPNAKYNVYNNRVRGGTLYAMIMKGTFDATTRLEVLGNTNDAYVYFARFVGGMPNVKGDRTVRCETALDFASVLKDTSFTANTTAIDGFTNAAFVQGHDGATGYWVELWDGSEVGGYKTNGRQIFYHKQGDKHVNTVNGLSGDVTLMIPTVPDMATDPDMDDWDTGKTVDAAVLKTIVTAAGLQVSALEDDVDALENAGYQTAQQVQTAISTAISGKAEKTPRIAKASTDTTATLNPNTLYVFPEMSALTITLVAPADLSIVNEYHFIFTSGATATTLTLPATINQPDGFTVEANHVYEVSILEGCMTAQGWAVS